MKPNDAELLERWRSGDQSAGTALFERYYRVIERFFANKIDTGVGDLVQETFQGCVEGRDRVKNPAKFREYLFSIAHNVFRSYLRKRYRQPEMGDIEEATTAMLSPGPRTLMEAKNDEQRLLLEGLRNIPAKYQVILELYYWENLSTVQMAEIMEITPAAANGLLQRARTRLERALRSLASSEELLRSTLQDLDGWARAWRKELGREPPSGS